MATPHPFASTIRDAQRITTTLARVLGDRTAVAWAHSAALVRHAAQVGLIDPPAAGDAVAAVRASVEQLAATHPGLGGLCDPTVNPIWGAAPPGDAAAGLVALWEAADMSPNPHRHDGYLIGDLYQELSEEARKGRALCQTPKFVTDLLLDIAFDPAYREFGPHIRMIDPACGTGHILVETLIRTRIRQESGFGRDHKPSIDWRLPALDTVTTALEAVHGVDIDPYAALLSRYRLLLVARDMLHARRYDPTPAELAALPLHVAAADSLLDEDEPLLARGRYHVVIANPPYITCKDKTQREAIRARYRQVCSGTYSMAVPFEPLMHELCVPGGWVVRLTANSFMKREFGRRLIEQYFPTVDLQWIIDTSGAFIPGHGTPTVILASRNQPPSSDTVHTIFGKKGEPCVPEDPARGVVWSAIRTAVGEKLAFLRLAEALAPPEPVAATPAPAAARPAVYTQPSLLDLLEPDSAPAA